MSYKCSKCGLGVLVTGLPEPIRKCNCTVDVERLPITKWEKFKSLFGIKFYNQKKASIVCDMEAHAYGKGSVKA